MFKCADCNCAITAEHKTKYIKSENKVKGHDYYHCTHKKKDAECKQMSVEQREINDEIIKKLKKLKLAPVLLE
jgi:hypothetical protein